MESPPNPWTDSDGAGGWWRFCGGGQRTHWKSDGPDTEVQVVRFVIEAGREPDLTRSLVPRPVDQFLI